MIAQTPGDVERYAAHAAALMTPPNAPNAPIDAPILFPRRPWYKRLVALILLAGHRHLDLQYHLCDEAALAAVCAAGGKCNASSQRHMNSDTAQMIWQVYYPGGCDWHIIGSRLLCRLPTGVWVWHALAAPHIKLLMPPIDALPGGARRNSYNATYAPHQPHLAAPTSRPVYGASRPLPGAPPAPPVPTALPGALPGRPGVPMAAARRSQPLPMQQPSRPLPPVQPLQVVRPTPAPPLAPLPLAQPFHTTMLPPLTEAEARARTIQAQTPPPPPSAPRPTPRYRTTD